MTTYAIEVRDYDDAARLLGHVNCPVPSYELPSAKTFQLRGSVRDRTFTTVTLEVGEFREGSASWRAFRVPASQWAEIKDKIR